MEPLHFAMLLSKFNNFHIFLMGQWIARLLPKPRAQVRAPLHKLAINVDDPQGTRQWIKKNIFLIRYFDNNYIFQCRFSNFLTGND